MAMLPSRSTAALGMKRFFESGLYVDACRALPIVPPVTGTWYQRTTAWLELLPATVWLSHSDSRVLPSSSGTSDGPTAQLAPVAASVGPVKVEFAVLFQSTWNFQMLTTFVKPVSA